MGSNTIAIIGLGVSVLSFCIGRYSSIKKSAMEEGADWEAITIKLEMINKAVEKIEEQVKEINVALINSRIDKHDQRLNVLEKDYKELIKNHV